MTNDEIRMTNEIGITKSERSSSGFFSPFVIRYSSFIILAVLCVTGCFPKPNKANIELRKQVQTLEAKVSDLETTHDSDRAQIDRLAADRTIQTLPADKLERLFTTSAIKFKNIVVGEDLDSNTPGDEGFKIGLTPIDQAGDEFKAAGSLTVELFDLAAPETRLGEWKLDTVEARSKWLSSFVFDGYVLHFPWQTPPTHDKLLVKVTFVDELTGRSFETKSDLMIRPPGKN